MAAITPPAPDQPRRARREAGWPCASYDPASFHRDYPNSKLLVDATLRSDLSDEQRASFEEARRKGSDEIDLGESQKDG
jgi:hypothetical protein